MDDARVVRRGYASADLARYLDRLVGGEPSEALEHGGKLFAPDELHRDEAHPLVLADVVDAADVAVRNLARYANLSVKARERRAVQRERFGQELQRDGLFERQVFGAVDLAHATASQEADDAVALVEDRAGDEARAFERV